MERLTVSAFSILKGRAILLFLILFSVGQSVMAQADPPSIVGQLPTISPPSPTVAGLMKFEEVSVNHYTGIPDVSIPLYSVQTLSPDITMDISLNYHPSSIAVEEVAGYTGLGWNLFAGGSIARTVKGSPDEKYSRGVQGRIGILQDNPDPGANYEANRYNEVLALLGSPTLTPDQTRMIGEYGWGVAQKGTFDTQHDLWQYNFMGHTGRFFIKRDFNTGNLVPVKLDNDNSMMITISYTQSAYDYVQHSYTINFTGFTLYDDKGYKYVFGAVEQTVETNALATMGYQGLGNGGPVGTPILNYPSAFNLTEVWDNNDQKLINISYVDAKELVKRHTESRNFITGPPTALEILQSATGPVYGLPARETTSWITTDVSTKKISVIEIINKARIFLDTGFGRDDSNINKVDAPYLNGMQVKNWYGDLIKDYSFTHDYATMGADNTRMVLTGVTEKNTSGNGELLTRQLTYKNQNAGPGSKDYWGYYSSRTNNKEPDESVIDTNVLQKMILPTGGSIVFDFEPNTYSYIGNDPVTDFTIDDPEELQIEPVIPDDGEIGIFPVPITMPEEVYFVPNTPVTGGQFYIRMEGESIMYPIDALGDNGLNDGTGISDSFTLKANTKYYLGYRAPEGTPSGTYGKVKVYKKNPSTSSTPENPTGGNQWLMGGGIRIKNISYYTEDNTSQVPKVKNYNYQSFANPTISSGSLAFAKPLFKFYTGRTAVYVQMGDGLGGGTTNPDPHINVLYTTTTTHNNLAYIRTKGSDVGYQNVTVSETGNGKTEYTYTSPRDFPGQYEVTPPFRPLPNDDYKRGLLLKVKHYAQTTINGSQITYKPLVEDIYTYAPEGQMNDSSVRTGHAMDPSPSWAAPEYETWGDFVACINVHCLFTYGGEQYHFSNIGGDVLELFGWPQILEKTTNNYFYPEGSTVAKIVSTNEKYKYNFTNKRIEEITKTNSTNDVLTTKYFYDTTPSSRNRIGAIKKIESRKNNLLVDTKEIQYSKTNWGGTNNSLLPITIKEAKGDHPLEASIQMKRYDLYSNPLEASQQNGMNICYIWGYHSSQPIATIENLEYSLLTSNSMIQDIVNQAVTASNDNDASSLLDKLELLRLALPATATMTGYAYKPLIGVTTILDARGKRLKFQYDGFGRLKEVRDNEGKLLSENEYHYRTQ